MEVYVPYTMAFKWIILCAYTTHRSSWLNMAAWVDFQLRLKQRLVRSDGWLVCDGCWAMNGSTSITVPGKLHSIQKLEKNIVLLRDITFHNYWIAEFRYTIDLLNAKHCLYRIQLNTRLNCIRSIRLIAEPQTESIPRWPPWDDSWWSYVQ